MAQVMHRQAMEERRAVLKGMRDSLVSKLAPLRAEREAVRAQMAPLEVREREIIDKIHALERPDLVDIDNELAIIARALGARSLQAEP